MKEVKEILSGNFRQRSKPKPLLPKEEVESLWIVMLGLFGQKWVSNYGMDPDPDNIWASCLKGIAPDQIRYGLNKVSESGLEWPPSAPQFRAMCKPPSKPPEHIPWSPDRALSGSTHEERKASAKKWLGKAMELLNESTEKQTMLEAEAKRLKGDE